MATTGSRGVTAVTSRRRSWHSLPSCYRASLPRRDERTGPQPLAARPLHVKAEGEPLQCPPTLRRHWSSNTTRLRARQPHQPKTPRVGTDAAPDVFALPLSPPLPESQTNSDIIHRSRGKRWSRCVQGPRTQEIRETGAGTEPSHRSVCPRTNRPQACSAAIVAPPPGITRV